ncbi:MULTISPECIES: sensor histidine kinase [unclassified Microbacterium]|uniref:sensor histidine kinase n=1 Tax=unclassified Microbacterium TaxID=2609290 RepID=UPI000CFDAE4A|nr:MULTISPECIES: histidine kinase [unclassified Microbacterium]PQZ58320.1 sensor histidine kinase [Microbacterium sp. MYb43]PQZ73737.1 sensor histidine kinase [Microbacterium sp. MYb40]PRB20500.1 sensor histidine kinase [Microbacterium sp. MYb50]PRB20514.1 sensor histidine kinase [Microbacterium sp. MYb54]PRB66138.1 sensor histidine kinase [Microbacterium sp. MYb32]
MSSRVEPLAPVELSPGARQLSRGVTATWWYTVTGVLALEIALVASWTLFTLARDLSDVGGLIVGVGGLLWCASTVPLLLDYRHRLDAEPGVRWLRLVVPLLVAVAYGVAAGAVVGSWQLALMPLAQTLVLLNWPRGVRYKVVIAAVLLLVFLAVADSAFDVPDDVPFLVSVIYTVMLPVMTVSSLWWWDVLITLDRARASEAKLAATQERLRVATDVHDLQGHHLQVIALQLELAERLMPQDAGAGMDQLRAARASVDDARQGTRDLALRFRSVPLGDEIANARDLLRAAGLEVEAVIPADSDAAPASALGPVIRETTTNVLRHGGGRRARLELSRIDTGWQYMIANDIAGDEPEDAAGSGLDGIRRRIDEVHGTLEIGREAEEFKVTVTVPAQTGDAR